MTLTIAAIEERIKNYEKAIEQSLANHNAMVGALQELKNLLDITVKVADVVAPASVVTEALNAADELANTAENAISSVNSEDTIINHVG